jgi:ESCRT-II complex subunit VPS36
MLLHTLQVAVIERYQAALTSRSSSSNSAESTSEDEGGLNSLMLDIGIASPVTKGTAGTQYHQQLARQLADFLGHSTR